MEPTQVIGPSTRAEARLEVSEGRSRNDPATLKWTATNTNTGESATGELEAVGDGLYRGFVSAATAGSYRLVVSYPDAGISSAEVTLSSDLEAPQFAVTVDGPQVRTPSPLPAALAVDDPVPGYGSTAYRRDETVTVRLSSDAADFDGARVEATITGIASGGAGRIDTLTVAPATDCGASYCGTINVDLSATEMIAFRGEMILSIVAHDLAGNAAARTVPLKVTRWKWAYDAGGAVKVTPAIGAAGTIYFGSSAAADNVLALRPNGSVVWKKTYGKVEGSVSVGAPSGGKERVYVGATTGSGAMFYALDDATGDVLVFGDSSTKAECGPYSGGTVVGSLAVSETTAQSVTIESSHGVYNAGAGAGELIALRPGAGTGKLCVAQPDVRNIPYGAGVVVNGVDALFSDAIGNIRSYTFNGGAWDEKFITATNYFTKALAVAPSAGTLFAGGGGPGSGAVLTLPLSGTPVVKLEGTVTAHNPAVGGTVQAPAAVVGFDDATIRRFAADLTGEVSRPTDGVIKGTPAVGQDQRVYSGTDLGRLEVRALTDLSRVWAEAQFGPLPTDTLGDASASVALDCARPPGGGAPTAAMPGTLYVGSATTNKLYAFIVDARGLDVSSPWPKFQHDQRNTGNPATQIESCP